MSTYYYNNSFEIIENNKRNYNINKDSKLQYQKEYYIKNAHKIKEYKKKMLFFIKKSEIFM
jgi:hypothetical protein